MDNSIHIFTTAPQGDYIEVNHMRLDFTVGQERVCHIVEIIDDDICETDPMEDFFSNLVLGGGDQPISVNSSQTRVVIDDSNETECG